MTDLLTEFITDILSLGEARPDKVSPVPRGLFAGRFGKYYTDKELQNYAGKVVSGKWVAAAKQTTIPTKKAGVTSSPKQTPQLKKTVKSAPKQTNGEQVNIKKSAINLTGSKGVLDAIVGITEQGSAGAGTKESRAAEASVVLVINDLLQKRKTAPARVGIDEFMSQNDTAIDALIRQLGDLPNSAINSTWFNPIKRQVVGTISEIEKRYGKISEVIWDNKEGRDRFGFKKEEGRDRSDLYVRLDNGEIIGVSLKKDGNVFLANQGYEKIMGVIAGFARSDSTKKKIQGLQSLHKYESDKALENIITYTAQKKNSLANGLSKLKRTDIKDVESKDYDKFFNQNTNTILPNVINSILSGDLKGDKIKLLTKSLGALAKTNKTIEELMINLRQVDNKVTHKLIDLMNSDSEMNETVKSYMLDVLDMPQMLSTDPFPGISRVVTVYGAGNVDDMGNSTALFTDGSTLHDTFQFDEGLSQDEMTKQLSDKFIIDAEKDSRVGYIRLKTKNPSPPPAYFYPTVASLGVRARGLGSAGVFELYQQNAWTFTLAAKNPNPEMWTPAQRKAHAKDTLKFLNRQLANESLSASEKAEIQRDIDFYSKIQ